MKALLVFVLQVIACGLVGHVLGGVLIRWEDWRGRR